VTEPEDTWLTLKEAHALLIESKASRMGLRTLQRSLLDDDRRRKHWERTTPKGVERGWTTRAGIERTEYLVKRSWVLRKIRDGG
jgi:hypothetical protein